MMRKNVLGLCGSMLLVGMCAQGVVLENTEEAIYFADESQGFAVTSIVAKAAGNIRFVHGTRYTDRGNFWSLEFRRQTAAGTNEVWWVNNERASGGVKRVEKSALACTFVWEGVDLPDEKGAVDIRARVRLAENAEAKWSIDVENRSEKWALGNVRYPILAGVVKPREADVLIPTGWLGAKVVTNFVPLSYSTYRMRSPAGWAPMLTAYMKEGAGLYIAAHDSAMRNKTLWYWGDAFYFETPVENAGIPKKAARTTGFETTTACFKGDWWQAAKRYRAWALQQKWAAKGPIAKRADYPKSLAEVDIWVRVLGRDYTCLKGAQKLWPDVKLGVRHYCWHVQKYDTNCPEYQPMDGQAKFWAAAKKEGVLVTPYVNGRLWDRTIRSFRYAKRDACLNEDGTPFIETFTPRCAVMCPAAKDWQSTLLDMGLDVVENLGANGIYYDQINCASWKACRNPTHGHPLEGGAWWMTGYRKALEPIKAKFAAAGVPITSEGPGEMFLDLIDGALIVGRNRKSDDVPLMSAIYGGYTTFFCIEEEADDAPAAMFARQIQGVMFGCVSGSWDDKRLFDSNPAKNNLSAQAQVLHRAARLRKAGRHFLAYGTFEDTLRILEPNEKISFTHLPTRNRSSGAPSTQVEYSAIEGSVWKDVDGKRVGIFAANVTGQVRTFSLKAPGKNARAESIPGETPPPLSREGDILRITLPPQGIAFVTCEL